MGADQADLTDLLDPGAQGERQEKAFLLHSGDAPDEALVDRAEDALVGQVVGDGAPLRFLLGLARRLRLAFRVLSAHHAFELIKPGRRKLGLLAPHLRDPLLDRRQDELPGRRLRYLEAILQLIETPDQEFNIVPSPTHGFGSDGACVLEIGRLAYFGAQYHHLRPHGFVLAGLIAAQEPIRTLSFRHRVNAESSGGATLHRKMQTHGKSA